MPKVVKVEQKLLNIVGSVETKADIVEDISADQMCCLVMVEYCRKKLV